MCWIFLFFLHLKLSLCYLGIIFRSLVTWNMFDTETPCEENKLDRPSGLKKTPTHFTLNCKIVSNMSLHAAVWTPADRRQFIFYLRVQKHRRRAIPWRFWDVLKMGFTSEIQLVGCLTAGWFCVECKERKTGVSHGSIPYKLRWG